MIAYPLSHPTFGLKTVNFDWDHVVGANVSPFTRQSQIFDWGGDQVSAQITLKKMEREQAEQWITFLLSLNGIKGTFLLGDPLGVWRGTAGGAPVVSGAGQIGKTLVTSGWDAATTIAAGDYFQLGTGEQTWLHKILTDVVTDGAGNATLDITPRLRVSPTDAAALTIVDPKGTFSLASNKTSFGYDEMRIYGVSFDAAEALRF
jgi:hypothetical protein